MNKKKQEITFAKIVAGDKYKEHLENQKKSSKD